MTTQGNANGEGRLYLFADSQHIADAYMQAFESPYLAALLTNEATDYLVDTSWRGERPLNLCPGKPPRMWEVRAKEPMVRQRMQVYAHCEWVVCEVPSPAVTPECYLRFAIGCAWRRATAEWHTWATGWLDGTDRTMDSIRKLPEKRDGAASWMTRAAARKLLLEDVGNTIHWAFTAAVEAWDEDHGIPYVQIAEWAFSDAGTEALDALVR